MVTICNYFPKNYGIFFGKKRRSKTKNCGLNLPEKIAKQAPLLRAFFVIRFVFSQLNFRMKLYVRLVLVTL
jgi:hypothetical protein